MTLESWSTHAVFYEIDPHRFHATDEKGTGGLKGIVDKLDYIHSLGVDAIALTHFGPRTADGANRQQSIDPALGTMDDFDDLVREASRDGIRVVMELEAVPQLSDVALVDMARFWLSRGSGGISLRSSPSTPTSDTAQRALPIHKLRDLTRSFPGQRILVADAPSSDTASRSDRADLTSAPVFASVASFTATALRDAMARLQAAAATGATLVVSDGPNEPRSTARFSLGDGPGVPGTKVLATLLLATRANAQLFFGQEMGLAGDALPWGTPPADLSSTGGAKTRQPDVATSLDVATEEADPDSLLNWYRRLIDLHHGNATLRSGTIDLLHHDDQQSIVWVARRGSVSALAPAIVVACNLSDKPVTLSLVNDLRDLHLRGSFLRTVLRSDNGMGGMNLNAITLPPFGVYIGELRF